ncbi:hypothetical protein Tco_0413311 [Tanacetum coccineum]
MSDSEHSTITYTEVSSEEFSRSLDRYSGSSCGVRVKHVERHDMNYSTIEEDCFHLRSKATVCCLVSIHVLMSPEMHEVERRSPSRDDANDEEEEEDEDEEKGEHLAPADSIPPPACRTTTRMSIRAQAPTPFLSEAEIDRLLAIPSPPPLPLTSYLSPLPQIPSSPLPVSPPLPISPLPLHVSHTHLLGYKAATIQLRAESPSTSHPLPLPPPIILPRTRASMAMMRAAAPSTYYLSPPSGTPPILPIPLPTSSPPLLLPSTDCRADVPKVTLSPRKRLCIAPGPRYKIRETLSAPTARYTGGFRADYGFVGTLDAKIGRGLDREIGYGITDVWVDPDEIDIDEIYVRLDDAQDDRLLMSGQLNLLHKSRNGDDSHDTVTGVRRQALVARECTYPDFMKCQPLNFKVSEGVVELTQWFERMETVFRISNCTVENQIKFATFTLRGSAITLWNSHVKGTDVVSYNQRFQELALMYDRMFLEESDKIEKYVGGLPDMIHGSVMASKPKTMQDAIEFATELIDKKISTLAESQAENKRKLDNNNQAQQQPPKKQDVAIA